MSGHFDEHPDRAASAADELVPGVGNRPDLTSVVRTTVISGGRAVHTCSAALYYTAGDPFAVRLRIPAGVRFGERHVTWVFGRALLDEGTRVPTGEGDVQAWPADEGGTVVELHGTDAQLALRFDTADLRHFLGRTYRLVAAGRETYMLDLNGELLTLLGPR
jgi:sporulation and cell division protein SsgA